MNWWHFVVLSLAIAMLVRLAIFDAGPYAVLDKLRDRLGANANTYERGSLQHALNCPWCVSIWLSIVVATIYVVTPHYSVAAAIPLALAFVASAMIKLTHEV